MIKIIMFLAIVIFAGGCSGLEWDRPSAKYRDCMRENQADPSVCDKYKEQYEEKIDSKRGAPDQQHGEGRFHDK